MVLKQVLIISYDFPPSPIGIWRTLKFCRYMGEFGWEPSILTVKPVRAPRWDMGPLSELPPGTEIRRTGSFDQNRIAYILGNLLKGARGEKKEPAAPKPRDSKSASHTGFRNILDVFRRWVLIPDDRAGWRPFAIHVGRKWLREQDFDLIYTTSFPSTAHLVGEKLAREFNLPLVSDFRDIWVGNYYFYTPATRWHDRTQRRMERRVVEKSSAVISATGPITDDFLERYPDQPKEKFVTITNGFDPSDFHATNSEPDTSVYTITYAGTMYGSTSPRPFLRAIRVLLKKEPRWRSVLRLRFVGSMIGPYRNMIDKFGLDEITRVDPYLAHDEALGAMAAADALLLIVADVPGSNIMLTQKVFEYAAARRPIIGLVPDGAAKDFLQELNEGPVIHTTDSKSILRAVRSMLIDWEKNGRKTLPENPVLQKYERRNLTEQFCNVLDKAVTQAS